MKTIYSLLTILFFAKSSLFAAEEENISRILTPRGGVDPVAENKKLIEEFYQAIEENDDKKIDQILAPNYSVTDAAAPFDTEFSKYDVMNKNIKKRMKSLHIAFPEFSINVLEVIGEGNKVFARTLTSGIQKGPAFGIEPTNKPIAIKTFVIFTIERGKISDINMLWNELNVMKQIGFIAL